MTNGSTGFGLAIALILLCLVIGLYDIYCIYRLDREDTVSFQLRSWNQRFPLLGVMIGILIGHLFFPLPPPKQPEPYVEVKHK